MLNDKRIKAFISRYDNETLCLTADSSSSSDEDKTYEASPVTMSESSESPATAAAMLTFALKEKYKILTNKVRSLPVLYYSDGSNALLYEPMVNFSAKF